MKEQNIEIIKSALKNTLNLSDEFIMVIGNQLSRISLLDTKLVQTQNGIIPLSLVPYLEYEIISVLNYSALPETGNVAYRYVTQEEEIIGEITYPASHSYIWNGVGYADITANALFLGETSTTAYRGDRGKIGYNYAIGVLLISNEVLDSLFSGHGYTTTTTSSIFLDEEDINTEVLSVYAISGGDNTTATQIAVCTGGIYYRDYNATWGNWVKLLDSSDFVGYSKTYRADYYKTFFTSSVVGNTYTAISNGRLVADNGEQISNGDTVFVLFQGLKAFSVTNQGSPTTKAVLTAIDISNYDFVIAKKPYVCCFNNGTKFIRLATREEIDSINSVQGLSLSWANYYTETIPEFTESNGVITGVSDDILSINGVELTEADYGATIFLLFPVGNRTLNGLYEITDIGSEDTPYVLTKISTPDVVKIYGGDEYIKISSDSVNIEYGRLNELKKKTYYASTTNSTEKVEFIDEDGNSFSLNDGEYKEVVISATSESSSYGIGFGKVLNIDSSINIYQNQGGIITFEEYDTLDDFNDSNAVGIIQDTQKLFCIGEYETNIFWKATVVNYIK